MVGRVVQGEVFVGDGGELVRVQGGEEGEVETGGSCVGGVEVGGEGDVG